MSTFSEPTRRRKNGKLSSTYWIRITDGKRRTWKSTKVTTLKLARQVRKKWQVRDALGELWEQDGTVGEAVDAFLAEKKSRAGKACLTVWACYGKRIKDRFGSRLARSITKRDIEAYLAERQADGLKGRSLNNERGFLRQVFGWAIQNGFARKNPCQDVEKYDDGDARVRALDGEEEAALLAAAKVEGIYGPVLFLLETGLRPSLLDRFEWSDIDFKRREWRNLTPKMKTKRTFDGVPIPDRAFEWFKANARTAGPIFDGLPREQFAAAAEAAGLEWLKPKHLRKNFITRCRRAGIDVETVMYLSHHHDLKTVMKHYRQVEAADGRAVLA